MNLLMVDFAPRLRADALGIEIARIVETFGFGAGVVVISDESCVSFLCEIIPTGPWVWREFSFGRRRFFADSVVDTSRIAGASAAPGVALSLDDRIVDVALRIRRGNS